MIRSSYAAVGMMMGALVLSACGTSTPQPGTPPTALVVTDQESCQQIELQHDQPLVVRFESNPSTGYRWSLLQESSILQLVGSHFVAPRPADDRQPMVGAPGVQEWQFTPRQAGQETLVFNYRQPWERTAYRKVECHVSVKPSSH